MVESYSEKLRDPRWQKKRLEIMQRDKWTCQFCGDKEANLQIHHIRYIRSMAPWDYENFDLQTLCELCHGEYSKYERIHGKPEFFESIKFYNESKSLLFYLTEKGLFSSRDLKCIPVTILKPLHHFTVNTWMKHG